MELAILTLKQIFGTIIFLLGIFAFISFAFTLGKELFMIVIDGIRVRLRNNERFMAWLDSVCEDQEANV